MNERQLIECGRRLATDGTHEAAYPGHPPDQALKRPL